MLKAVDSADIDLADTPFSGVKRKKLVQHENTLLYEIHIEGGGCVSTHHHPHEQAGYLIRGAIELEVAGEKRVCRPGSAWVIPGDTPHGATAIEPTVLIEIFSPPPQA